MSELSNLIISELKNTPNQKAKAIAKNNQLLKDIAKTYGKNKTWAHVMIRWCFQNGFIVLPKSTKFQRILENANIFDFEISKDDMNKLDLLQKEKFRASWNPLIVEWDL